MAQHVATTRTIHTGTVEVSADLAVPDGARGVVVFAHGSGSSRLSPRNRQVAEVLQEAGLATLLTDLLTADEDAVPQRARELAFDVHTLSRRFLGALEWVERHEVLGRLPAGAFGASTGAAAALIAATARPDLLRAVVSRGGRPDLASAALGEVRVPVLLVVGGADEAILDLNERALEQLATDERRLDVVPDATHLFEEPGALERVAELARDWFVEHLPVET